MICHYLITHKLILAKTLKVIVQTVTLHNLIWTNLNRSIPTWTMTSRNIKSMIYLNRHIPIRTIITSRKKCRLYLINRYSPIRMSIWIEMRFMINFIYFPMFQMLRTNKICNIINTCFKLYNLVLMQLGCFNPIKLSKSRKRKMIIYLNQTNPIKLSNTGKKRIFNLNQTNPIKLPNTRKKRIFNLNHFNSMKTGHL